MERSNPGAAAIIRSGSLYDRFQGYLPGFVPRDCVTRNTLGMGHTTPTATSGRKTRPISMFWAETKAGVDASSRWL